VWMLSGWRRLNGAHRIGQTCFQSRMLVQVEPLGFPAIRLILVGRSEIGFLSHAYLPFLDRSQRVPNGVRSQTFAQRIHRVEYVAGIARFHGRAHRIAFSLFVQQLDEGVFIAVFKFARFDRLQPEEMLRCKPKFSVSVAIAAVAVAAVTAVAAAAVAAVAVIVTVIGRVAVGAVKGAGA
jgi:hypothetical protein